MFNNLIILDQEWALKGIYAVVQRGGHFYEILQSAKGNTTLNILGKIWKEYPLDTQKVFLSMMENREICFQTTEHKLNPGYLIPEFLPEAKHDTIQAFWEEIKPEELSLKYQHDFFHPAFMTRFICRAGRLAKSYDYLWKNGIWITYGPLLVADLAKTMERFDTLLKDCSLKNDLTLKRGELSFLEKYMIQATLDYEKSATQTNQIRGSVLALIDRMKIDDLIENEVLRFLLDG